MQIYSDLLLSAKKTFKEKWNTSLTVGNNIWHNKTTDDFSRGRNMAVPGLYNLNNTSERYASNSTYASRTYALFFDGSIDYKSAIFLGLTGRNEWASAYDKGKRSYFYPAVNTSIVISELVKLPKWFSFAKVRASYAKVGLAPSSYQNKTYYSQNALTDGFTNGNSFPFLGNVGYGVNNSLGSTNLKPEKQRGLEYGVDLRFFGGRLNLDVTYYDQKSSDVLLYSPISPSSGANQIYTNSAQISNKGWEIALSATPIEKKNFKWDINLTWYKNVSKVLKLADGVTELNIEDGFDGIGAYAIVGQPFGAFYGTTWQKTSEGKLIIDPNTGLPIQDPKNQNLGNSQPDWLSGIRNTLTYKNFSFTFLWDIRKGGKIWNGTRARLNSLGTTKESEDRDHDYTIEGVQSTGIDANGNATYSSAANTTTVSARDYYQIFKGDPAYGGVTSTVIEDGSWIRLREVSLSYRLNFKNKKFIQYLDLSVSGRNLLLFTRYSGVDPETSLTGAGSNIQGYDYFNNPGTKSIYFGLKAGF
jgi:outer membrane receptor protein involved in Fe transport